MAEITVDFAAAGRVASRAELKAIRLIEISAKCDPETSGALEPTLDHDCAAAKRSGSALEIACNYRFKVRTTQAEVADASIKYLLVYELQGPEPFADEDIAQFAKSNGTLHSWPFVRELLYALTSRMGYPPYTLPVFHFKAKPPQQEKAEVNAEEPAQTSTPSAKQ
ncbi:MAG: hypothetical protein WB780_19650 [Candidatus Acidiferrales bacterium]